MNQEGRLAGKRAFIVGATSEDGMGFAVASRFVSEGARVVLGGRKPDALQPLAERLGGVAVECDITSADSLSRAVEQAASAIGGMDVAFNAAGVNRACLIGEETAEGLEAQARIHFVGTTLFIRYVAAAMGRGGSIITVSSLTAERSGANLAAYAASKAAADKVMEIAAIEYGSRGIRINALAPGLTRTAMTESYFANPAVLRAFEHETPLGALANAGDVAAAAVWLASDECIATGERLRVSAGMHLRRLPTARDFQTSMLGD
jgi:NAD(P)-dependent dehydrogenase (short-subunit alcohol dehydrogenase family)